MQEPKLDFHYVPHSPDHQSVYFGNVTRGYTNCGEFYKEIDGFWVYSIGELKGGLEGWFLQAIANKLDSLNLSWENQIADYLSRHE